jgi:hypothetical protein
MLLSIYVAFNSHTAFQIFFKTREILEHILHQSTLYSVQQRPSKAFNAKVEKLEQFIEISIYRSIIQLPELDINGAVT